MSPEISVLVPVYNAEKYLPDCLQSLQNQTFTDFEIVCVNDGSTDKSGALLSSWAAREKRLRVVNVPNAGVAEARNRLLTEAKGKYIAFVDADDWVEPDYLAKLHTEAQKTGATLTKCFFREYNDKTGQYNKGACSSAFYRRSSDKPADRLLSGHYDSVVWGKLYLRSWVEKEHIRFLPGYVAEDVSFSLLGFLCAPKIHIVPQVLYVYRKAVPRAITSHQEKMFVGILHNHFYVSQFLERHQNLPLNCWLVMARLLIGDLARLRKMDRSGQEACQELFEQTLHHLGEIKKSHGMYVRLFTGLFLRLAGNKMNKRFYFWAKVFR